MKIKVFTFQKDETDILEDWIDYHGYLFGIDNIYIIDHDSKNCKELIQNKGAHLVNFSGKFEGNKASQLTKLINEHKNNCDFVIPLDVDEFILKQDGKEISANKEDILDCFEKLGGCGAYKFSSYSVARHDKDPLTEFIFVTDIPDHGRFERWKTFWRSGKFVKTDQGNHGTVGPYEKTNLSLLHFHHRGFEHFKRKHLRWPESYGQYRSKTSEAKNKHHWELFYDKIKNMNEQEMFQYWQTLCVEKEDNSYKYNSFKTKIKKIREKRNETMDEPT